MFQHQNAYDRGLLRIREQVLILSEMVGKQFDEAIKSFIEQDDALAEEVITADDPIDILDAELETEALELISLQQPVDQELRFLDAAMRTSRELERISDYACDIAESALRLKQKGQWFKPLIDLPHMAGLVRAMLKKSMAAFKENNLAAARQMDDDDREVDDLYIALYEELTEVIRVNPENVDQAFSILLITRYLERIGDHIVNISEMQIFAETGVRHPFKRWPDTKGNGK